MVIVKYLHISTPLSLGIVVAIIATSILASVITTRREEKSNHE